MSWTSPHNYGLYRITTLNIPAVPKLSVYERHSVQFVWHLQAFYSTFPAISKNCSVPLYYPHFLCYNPRPPKKQGLSLTPSLRLCWYIDPDRSRMFASWIYNVH